METFLANDGAYVVLGFAALSVPAAPAIVAYFWYKVRRDETVASLKRELSDRGMTAEEIRAVIEATPPRLDRCCPRPGRAQRRGFQRCQRPAPVGRPSRCSRRLPPLRSLVK
jgi:hypothetical protein